MKERSSLWAFARVCALLAPLALLAADVMQLASPRSVLWTILFSISFACFVPALAGLIVSVHRAAALTTLLGSILVLIGVIAGGGMQAYFRARILLSDGGHGEAIAYLQTQPAMALSTLVPGIGFPVGLLVLAVAMLLGRTAPVWLSACLALGALLFPIGHAAGIPWALIAGDVVLLVAFAAAARLVIGRGSFASD